MFYKKEFIDSTNSFDFLHIGLLDIDELSCGGYRTDKSISVELDALQCLQYFPEAINLILRPGSINTHDLVHLYGRKVHLLKIDYYSDEYDEYAIDLSRFELLEQVFTRTEYSIVNIQKCTSLRKLIVQEWNHFDLSCLGKAHIQELKILSGKLKSLNGIEGLCKLMMLFIANQKQLKDITMLDDCSEIKHLVIESCNKVSLDTIPYMESLHCLAILGTQRIAKCIFFTRFPNLEYLWLDVKIEDGDLSRFTNLQHCVIFRDYRHYSHTNKQLPKSTTNRCYSTAFCFEERPH